MESRVLLFLVICCFISLSDLHPLIHPSNELRVCHKNEGLPALEVLPGGGWDNLRNIDMGRVMNMSYSQCQITEDGVYLIPDEVFVIPQKESGLETNSEIIMSWLNQSSSTSSSINADLSFSTWLNGKFSVENQRIKTHQVQDKSVTSRVQIRNRLYTVKAYPDFTLDSRFVQQAEEIADAMENNQTRLATYLSEKLIRDYGTHVITSVDAGATLVEEDYLKMSYVSNSQSNKLSLSASAGLTFFEKFKINISFAFSTDKIDIQGYQSNIAYSLTKSHGGDLFYPGITLQKWQESTLNNLVAIDRSGLPLHYFLNPSTFPDLPVPTVYKMALSVRQAARRYYKINTIPGCVNVNSKNFNFQANVDDGSCDGPVTNLGFGGFFRICTPLTSDGDIICDATAQTNPSTGDYTCPQLYNTTFLNAEIVEGGSTKSYCESSSFYCGFLWLETCSQQTCVNSYTVYSAAVKTYWCSTLEAVSNTGYLFGGIYGPNFQNPLTKSYSCPPNYFAQNFSSNGMMVCLSNDYEEGTIFSVPFGGFFSCQSGNPLSKGQSRCPPQFSQHLAAISDGCEILYCVQSGVFTGGQLKPIILPPFTSPPLIGKTATNTVAVMTESNQTWVRVGESKTWRLMKLNEISRMASMSDKHSSQMSGGQKAGVAVGVMVLVALVFTGTVLIIKRRMRKFDRFQNRGTDVALAEQCENAN